MHIGPDRTCIVMHAETAHDTGTRTPIRPFFDSTATGRIQTRPRAEWSRVRVPEGWIVVACVARCTDTSVRSTPTMASGV